MGVALGGCTHFDRSVAADSATTAYALTYVEGAAEGNPLLPDPAAGAGLASLAATYAVAYKYPALRPAICRVKYGAAANNLAVIAGASGVVPAAVGVAVWVASASSYNNP